MTQEAHGATAASAAPVEPGPVARLLQAALPGVEFEIGQSPKDEVVTIQRDDFLRVMDAVKNDDALAFDYLRCLSGVDYLTDLETVYHLHSFKHHHSVAIKVQCPPDDAARADGEPPLAHGELARARDCTSCSASCSTATQTCGRC